MSNYTVAINLDHTNKVFAITNRRVENSADWVTSPEGDEVYQRFNQTKRFSVMAKDLSTTDANILQRGLETVYTMIGWTKGLVK